jgi:dethiobiotin synthetase
MDPSDTAPTDADVLAAATGEMPTDVCPPHRWYRRAMAPPMAAASLGLPGFTLADLASELLWPDAAIRWIESAGGPRSPLADDGDTVDFCRLVAPDLVVLVADAGLGTINATLLAAAALHEHELAVVLNRYDDASELHRRNRSWLSDRCGIDPVVDTAALASGLGQRGDHDRRLDQTGR